jgi:hypothetical protein
MLEATRRTGVSGRPPQPHKASALHADMELAPRLPPPQDAAGVAQWRAGNKAFRAEVDAAVEAALGDDIAADVRSFASGGNFVTDDWKDNPNGQGYVQGPSAAGRPDVFGWAAGVLAPRVQAVFEDFSQRYDWGDPG